MILSNQALESHFLYKQKLGVGLGVGFSSGVFAKLRQKEKHRLGRCFLWRTREDSNSRPLDP